MRIYEIATGYTPVPAQMGAATEIVVEELTKSFLKASKDVSIVDIATDERAANELPIIEVPVPKLFKRTDVKLGIMHKMKRVIYSICLSNKLKKLITNDEKCILHFHNQYNLFFFLLLSSKKMKRKCTILYTNHSYIWHGEWDSIRKTIKKKYFQEIFCMRHADRVFVLNEEALNNIANNIGIPKEKIVLIDNGVNTNVYKPLTQKEIIQLKEKKNLKDKKIFCQVGSVCDRKNQYESLELLIPIMKNNKDVVFVYAGGIIDQDYKEKIEELAERESVGERVIYLGELKPGVELNNLYNMSEAMIFPSKAEGFSLVIVEAMSSGIPVIINNTLKFKLSDSCTKFSNKEDFKIIIENILLKKDYKTMKEKVRTDVLEEYSWDKIADDYLNAISFEWRKN